MEILILLVIFSAGVGYWANSWGRNGWLWVLQLQFSLHF
jgi:hypothetical protein